MNPLASSAQTTSSICYIWLTQTEAKTINAGIDMLLAFANLELPVRLVMTGDACVWLHSNPPVADLDDSVANPCKRLKLLELYDIEPILVGSEQPLVTELETELYSDSQLQEVLRNARHVVRY